MTTSIHSPGEADSSPIWNYPHPFSKYLSITLTDPAGTYNLDSYFLVDNTGPTFGGGIPTGRWYSPWISIAGSAYAISTGRSWMRVATIYNGSGFLVSTGTNGVLTATNSAGTGATAPSFSTAITAFNLGAKTAAYTLTLNYGVGPLHDVFTAAVSWT